MLETSEFDRLTVFQQLKRWFQNHASDSRTARAAAAPLPCEVTGLSKTRRAPHVREVYLRMYYDEARRGVVAAALDNARNDGGTCQVLLRAETMLITRKAFDEMYAAEPDSVKDAVATRVRTEMRLLNIIANASASASNARTPEDYQRYATHSWCLQSY